MVYQPIPIPELRNIDSPGHEKSNKYCKKQVLFKCPEGDVQNYLIISKSTPFERGQNSGSDSMFYVCGERLLTSWQLREKSTAGW